VITTGTTPWLRQHLYFCIKGGITDAATLKAANSALRDLLSSDDVTDAIRIMRLGGCLNYPTKKKRDRGYVAELVTVKVAKQPREYSVEELISLLRPAQPHQRDRFAFNGAERPSSLGFKYAKSDNDIWELLQKSKTPGQWHNSMRDAIASMIGRGWTDLQVRLSCAPYCNGGANDLGLTPLIDGARSKWGKPNGGSQGGASQDGGSSQNASLPVINVSGGELSSLAVLGEKALISANVPIYQRGGNLVRPIVETVDATRGRMTNVVRLKVLDATYLRDLLCRHARWTRYDGRRGVLSPSIRRRVLRRPSSRVPETGRFLKSPASSLHPPCAPMDLSSLSLGTTSRRAFSSPLLHKCLPSPTTQRGKTRWRR
jgi:hypothetical protein